MGTSTGTARVKAPEASEQLSEDRLPVEEQIRQVAHQIWLENGSPAGSELIDWLDAEKESPRKQR